MVSVDDLLYEAFAVVREAAKQGFLLFRGWNHGSRRFTMVTFQKMRTGGA